MKRSLWFGLFALGCSLGCSAPSTPSLGEHHAASFMATCDSVMCADPEGCAASCEAQYGASSGLPYSTGAMGETPPCSAHTNSDCYSVCFRDCCLAGGEEEDIPFCTCAMAPWYGIPNVHNYWCCQDVFGSNPWGTIQGWSTTNYCATPATATAQ